jgi:hypothetical protein
MEPIGGAGFLASILGGMIVAAANWLFNGADREKKRAEAHLAQEQAKKTQAETTEIMKRTQTKPLAAKNWGEAPRGWSAGDLEGASDDYVVGIEQVRAHSGRSSAYIRSTTEEPRGFGALSQRFSAREFAGEKIKLTGYIRAESVVGWAGLWMRVDGSDGGLQSFDNMENRPVRGTSEWVRREIVLDASANAFAIAIGALLVGCGQIWIDDLSLEVVPKETPTTAPEYDLPLAPTNLDFEIQ